MSKSAIYPSGTPTENSPSNQVDDINEERFRMFFGAVVDNMVTSSAARINSNKNSSSVRPEDLVVDNEIKKESAIKRICKGFLRKVAKLFTRRESNSANVVPIGSSSNQPVNSAGPIGDFRNQPINSHNEPTSPIRFTNNPLLERCNNLTSAPKEVLASEDLQRPSSANIEVPSSRVLNPSTNLPNLRTSNSR